MPHDHVHPKRRARKPTPDATLERAATICRAAGDVARLKLLEQLAEGEWCVTELAEANAVGMSTVSRQLGLLRNERLVSRRRQGNHLYYSLVDEHVIALIRNVIEHATEKPSKKGR